MKKSALLLLAVCIMAMFCCACGSSADNGKNPFEGQWTGTLDVTKQFEDGIKAEYQKQDENMDWNTIVDFDALVFLLDITFENGEMSMEVQQDSIDTFVQNYQAGMQKIGRNALNVWLDMQDLTLEEAVAESGMDEAAYLEAKYEEMGLDKMAASMEKITNASLQGLSKVKGAYTFDDTNIHIAFEDNTFEEMRYSFEGEQLTITITGDGFSLHIACEKKSR